MKRTGGTPQPRICLEQQHTCAIPFERADFTRTTTGMVARSRPARAPIGPPRWIELVHPMPPPGERGQCYHQSTTLFCELRKEVHPRLEFVGFKQPGDYGAHFVVEDERSVYDQTQRSEGHPEYTRYTPSSYWDFFENAPTPIVRFDNEKFQVLFDFVCCLHDWGIQPCCDQILATMMLIEGLWETGDAGESEAERFQRISERVLAFSGRPRSRRAAVRRGT